MSVEIPTPPAGEDGPPPRLLRRIRAALAASALLTAGFGVAILIEEPNRTEVIIGGSFAAAVVYALCLAALRGPSAGGSLAAAEGVAAAGFLFSALLFGLLAIAIRTWLDGVTLWLFVYGAVQGLLVRWTRQAQASMGTGRRAFAVVWRAVVVLVAILGFLTIIVPTNVHSPLPRNESATVGDIRTMISAQATYQSVNGGFYDVPECLVTPHRCIPDYSVNQPTFIDPVLGRTAADKSGYHRVFHPGPRGDPAVVRRAKASPSSLTSFAYVAVPLKAGKTGVRAFCGDSTGVLCYTPDGRSPAVENGQCAASCLSLQ